MSNSIVIHAQHVDVCLDKSLQEEHEELKRSYAIRCAAVDSLETSIKQGQAVRDELSRELENRRSVVKNLTESLNMSNKERLDLEDKLTRIDLKWSQTDSKLAKVLSVISGNGYKMCFGCGEEYDDGYNSCPDERHESDAI